MNDDHDNAATDKEMLHRYPPLDEKARMAARRKRSEGPADLLDWIDGLDDEASGTVLRWLADNRPTVLREAWRSYVASTEPLEPATDYVQRLRRRLRQTRGELAEELTKPALAATSLESRLALAKEAMGDLAAGTAHQAIGPERCDTCGRVHKAPEVIVTEGNVHLWPGHEYVIRTRIGTQKYPRESRMGYMGFGYGTEWSARGPDGTHDGKYGGTQHLDLHHIIYAKEVARDDAKRYVSRVVR